MVEVLLDLGVDFIQWISTLRNPVLDLFFLTLTDVGSATGYIVLLPIFWWAVSWRMGARLFLAFVRSVYVNAPFRSPNRDEVRT